MFRFCQLFSAFIHRQLVKAMHTGRLRRELQSWHLFDDRSLTGRDQAKAEEQYGGEEFHLRLG